MSDLSSSTFPDMEKSGVTSDAQKGAFKGANDLGKLPEGGASIEGAGGLQKRAQAYSAKHSIKGLGFKRAPGAKLKTITNVGRDIGRKRF
jgi:hypothetical protein